MSDVEPEICNCAALRQAARRVTKIYDDALAPSGLGVNQFSILARLSRVGPSTIQDLARLLVTDRSTLGHLLRPLEKRGLVRRRKSDTDGRTYSLGLTTRGRSLLQHAAELQSRHEARVVAQIGNEGRMQLLILLDRLSALPSAWPLK